MKKRLAILLGLSMAVSLWGTAWAAEPNYKSGTPWPYIDLEGVVTEDMNASLKDNFALAVNKDKILKLQIPQGYPFGGIDMDLVLKTNEDLKKMFQGSAPEGHDAKLAYDFYHLMMDWNNRNAQGIAPLKKITDKVEAIHSTAELSRYLVDVPAGENWVGLWESGAETDPLNSSRPVLLASSFPLLLDDSAEYSHLTDYGAIKKKANSELAEKMLVKLGCTKDVARQKIENCFALEAQLAPTILTKEEQNSPDAIARMNNRFSRDKLKEAQGKLPILEKLKKNGYPDADEYLVTMPAFLQKLNELYTEENLSLLKDYLIVHEAVETAGFLDRECYEWNFDRKNAISGSKGMPPDADVSAAQAADTLEWPVAQLYSATYLKKSDKERLTALVDQILDAYRGVINEADFLSAATRTNALDKLAAIDKRVLYPDNWENVACPELNFASPDNGGTLWQALVAIKEYEVAKNVRKAVRPIDKTIWVMTPQEVNCAYSPMTNAIHIAGGYAQGAMYNSNMSDEEMLGKIGRVIGHEISHAFDSTGAQFDKEGNMKNWWTKEDYAAFQKRNDKLVAYYNNMHPWAGQDFYGSIMTGEAGADMAGMKAILRVAATKKDFDYDKFYRAYAAGFLTKDTLQSAYGRINDVHPMHYLRINCTLQQFDEFLNFYGITEGDGMYLAPQDRVAIW